MHHLVELLGMLHRGLARQRFSELTAPKLPMTRAGQNARTVKSCSRVLRTRKMLAFATQVCVDVPFPLNILIIDSDSSDL